MCPGTKQSDPSSKELTQKLDRFLEERSSEEIEPQQEPEPEVDQTTDSIVVVGDIHAGLNFDFRIDPHTGISERAQDFHQNFVRAAQYTIEHQSKLFVVVGDVFERAHVAPTFREWIRRDIIEPLGDAGVEVWLVAGNHDQPKSSARATSLQDFRGYSHVKVFTEPAEAHLEIAGKTIGALIVPYLHPERIIKSAKMASAQDVTPEQLYRIGQVMLRNQLAEKANALKTDFKVLFAHYYIEGAKLRETKYPTVLPGEFQFKLEMIPNNLDLAVFGHVHLHQVVGKHGTTEVIYSGAIERIDWGERNDKKGFLVLMPFSAKRWKFVELPTRDMIKITVQLPTGTIDPTADILAKIPHDVTGKMIRLEVSTGAGVRQKIVDSKIEKALEGAFRYEIRITDLQAEEIAPISSTLDPIELFVEFTELNYLNHPKKEQILQIGKFLIEEALQ